MRIAHWLSATLMGLVLAAPLRAGETGSCLEGCGAAVQAAFHACREAGGGELDCAEVAVDAYQACVAEQCSAQPTCEERCQTLAAAAGNVSLEAGGTSEMYAAVRETGFSECVAELCTPDPADCEDRCAAFARGVFTHCIDEGVDEETCHARAEEAGGQCGRKLVEMGDNLLLRVPLLNKIYITVKQVKEAFAGNNSSFQQAVLVEFPRPGIYSLGFITSDQRNEVQIKTPETVWSVFVPTTPNPTSGFLVYVPDNQRRGIHRCLKFHDAVEFADAWQKLLGSTDNKIDL